MEVEKMENKHSKKLLVAVDGSELSLQTAHYLSDLSFFSSYKVNFFHVFNKVPESYYDLANETIASNSIHYVHTWEAEQHKQLERYMDQCRQLLLAAGFHSDRIETTIHNRQRGVARDIIAEARKGYDALITRRRGLSRIQGLIMGSVAYKLLNGAGFIPLIFAGRKPFNRRILMAVDGSDNAMRAVAYTGEALQGAHCKIKLLSVLRGSRMIGDMSPDYFEKSESFGNSEKKILEAQARAREQLTASGITPEAISTEIVKHATSRAGVLVEAAAKGNYNTIILGRRGMSGVHDFVIGRVSSKVLQIGREYGVWIIQ
jgi:nucleotide-binding universal stress UspA family protein